MSKMSCRVSGGNTKKYNKADKAKVWSVHLRKASDFSKFSVSLSLLDIIIIIIKKSAKSN